MKIVGFGDSFILGLAPKHSKLSLAYQGMIGEHYRWCTAPLECHPEFRGVSGTGPWSMFFDFLNYPDKEKIDVVIFAWSEISRLYHKKYHICNSVVSSTKNHEDDEYMDAVEASGKYYQYLFDHNQKNHELSALMMLVDEMSRSYPNTKFIHLPCFSKYDTSTHWDPLYDKIKPNQIDYYHRFKHGAEVRPCLMYLSKKDGWPDDLSKDTRECHMTPKMNRLLADAIIDCIEDYHPGKLVEIDIE